MRADCLVFSARHPRHVHVVKLAEHHVDVESAALAFEQQLRSDDACNEADCKAASDRVVRVDARHVTCELRLEGGVLLF